jgi:GTP-binding protein
MGIQFRNTEFMGVAARLDQCPPPNLPEVILSGRSNVGKSSLVNTLAGNRQLARTSGTPGKTRLVVYFKIDGRLLLTDLPGYGYGNVSKSCKQDYSSLAGDYLGSQRNIILILHLMDIRHLPTMQDKQMLSWLKYHEQPFQIVLTKADKMSRAEISNAKREIAAETGIADPETMIAFSAKTGLGADELRSLINSAFER